MGNLIKSKKITDEIYLYDEKQKRIFNIKISLLPCYLNDPPIHKSYIVEHDLKYLLDQFALVFIPYDFDCYISNIKYYTTGLIQVFEIPDFVKEYLLFI